MQCRCAKYVYNLFRFKLCNAFHNCDKPLMMYHYQQSDVPALQVTVHKKPFWCLKLNQRPPTPLRKVFSSSWRGWQWKIIFTFFLRWSEATGVSSFTANTWRCTECTSYNIEHQYSSEESSYIPITCFRSAVFIIDIMRDGFVVRPHTHILGGANSKVMKPSLAFPQLAFITSNYASAACAL